MNPFLNIFCIFADILPNKGVEHGLSSQIIGA